MKKGYIVFKLSESLSFGSMDFDLTIEKGRLKTQNPTKLTMMSDGAFVRERGAKRFIETLPEGDYIIMPVFIKTSK